ncbi:MAG: phospho-sugar mutase [Rikenellaceae bacterium]|nr:phospho-sugar mutase [Rikenellaceae bacterium]
MKDGLKEIAEKNASIWKGADYDDFTRSQVETLERECPEEFLESFYKNLEFGTGGLRGIMGVGTNRMNKYTVGMATQGFANYIRTQFCTETASVALAYDCRNNSAEFARVAANIFAANGLKVYLFESLRPTPELSYAIRKLGCCGGVVVTASHNPKEYNGYKAYWNDGAQVLTPHDKNIINEVNKITSPTQVKWEGNPENITLLGEEFDKEYMNMVESELLSQEAVAQNRDIKIVYTPIHGTGIKIVPQMLERMGFSNIYVVEAQSTPSGDFPTVDSPNPEEPAAMSMAMELAKEKDAELVFATDPDSDRIGLAIRDDRGELVLLNGNQTGSLLTYYILRRWSELGRIDGNQYILKTIVTTQLMGDIAESFGVRYFDVLTGFKYIAEVIRELEGRMKYICGGEESYGFLIGDQVRDKDAVIASAMIAEMAAWAKSQGMSLFQLLSHIYTKYGFYKEGLVSIVRKGNKGQQEIAEMMTNMRNNPPKSLGGSRVARINDFQSLECTDTTTSIKTAINQHKSNVLQWITESGTVVSARPSGTEPKIKFYFSVKEELPSIADFHKVEELLDRKIEDLKRELNLI